ncbi:hypothetical protein ACFWBX_11550 [Streptomyces sp. NPDC059991]|uniref:hypothetical protein n=1 Tax=Streptomyces sp. NPDC059991 TaxID=3347028 RepID=UPI0036B603D7
MSEGRQRPWAAGGGATWTAPGAPAQTVVSITLPVEYTAFCLQYQGAYLRYALLRLPSRETARACVAGALGELVTMWPAVIGSGRPSAVAWGVLRAWVRAAGGFTLGGTQTLTLAQDDALLLRQELQLSDTAIASVMGLDRGTVTSHLRHAERTRRRAD